MAVISGDGDQGVFEAAANQMAYPAETLETREIVFGLDGRAECRIAARGRNILACAVRLNRGAWIRIQTVSVESFGLFPVLRGYTLKEGSVLFLCDSDGMRVYEWIMGADASAILTQYRVNGSPTLPAEDATAGQPANGLFSPRSGRALDIEME